MEKISYILKNDFFTSKFRIKKMSEVKFFSLQNCFPAVYSSTELCTFGNFCNDTVEKKNSSNICPPCCGIPIAFPIAIVIDIFTFIPRMTCYKN